ncbi:hypothetical protein E1B28_006840 [Marasmius oreades]|uniref:Uncharacterized protein n=1 Tax=Marasmius oreades TaxID=181124 RepID=A0A9P7UWX4_9AGAR|nr:uncharacterized protein E1B28_006840 [Marasmius oreades]KAG7096167.1 hypothetical protein E1B28_006840 [Marasmius oreades]
MEEALKRRSGAKKAKRNEYTGYEDEVEEDSSNEMDVDPDESGNSDEEHDGSEEEGVDSNDEGSDSGEGGNSEVPEDADGDGEFEEETWAGIGKDEGRNTGAEPEGEMDVDPGDKGDSGKTSDGEAGEDEPSDESVDAGTTWGAPGENGTERSEGVGNPPNPGTFGAEASSDNPLFPGSNTEVPKVSDPVVKSPGIVEAEGKGKGRAEPTPEYSGGTESSGMEIDDWAGRESGQTKGPNDKVKPIGSSLRAKKGKVSDTGAGERKRQGKKAEEQLPQNISIADQKRRGKKKTPTKDGQKPDIGPSTAPTDDSGVEPTTTPRANSGDKPSTIPRADSVEPSMRPVIVKHVKRAALTEIRRTLPSSRDASVSDIEEKEIPVEQKVYIGGAQVWKKSAPDGDGYWYDQDNNLQAVESQRKIEGKEGWHLED